MESQIPRQRAHTLEWGVDLRTKLQSWSASPESDVQSVLQSRAEQSRAEQSRAEQSRAEQSRAEQSISLPSSALQATGLAALSISYAAANVRKPRGGAGAGSKPLCGIMDPTARISDSAMGLKISRCQLCNCASKVWLPPQGLWGECYQTQRQLCLDGAEMCSASTSRHQQQTQTLD